MTYRWYSCCECGCLDSIFAFFTGPDQYDIYEPLLLEDEREAVTYLLDHIKHPHAGFFEGKSLRALRTLSYSDNIDLQRSASLTFAEVTANGSVMISEGALEPIIVLAHSSDVGVQKAASVAMGNLALNDQGKRLMVEMGGITALVQLLHSTNLEVQCNACGCITNLATNDVNKVRISQAGALDPLVQLADSYDLRVQRNATGALLNLTHIEANRTKLVQIGAVPILINLLASGDTDIQYYSAAALSNLAVDETSRWSIVQLKGRDTFNHLVHLLTSRETKVQCQACLCLQNLALEEEAQIAIAEQGGLAGLLPLLRSDNLDLIVASIAAVRNLSINRKNEEPIVKTGFICVFSILLMSMWTLIGHDVTPPCPVNVPHWLSNTALVNRKLSSYEQAQATEIEYHVVGIVRNIAATEEYRMLLYDEQIIPLLGNILHRSESNLNIITEASAALSILSQHDPLKYPICQIEHGVICDLLIGLVKSGTEEVQINCANCLAGLATVGETLGTHDILLDRPKLSQTISLMLSSDVIALQHIGLWLTLQLSKG
eukprot:Ihof_evm23s27 gene=Ihof_evmTU23s27